VVSISRALALQPEFAKARLNLVSALIELDRFEEGLIELDRYIAGSPKDVNALLERGRTLEQLGRFPEAKECTLRALELAPDLAEGHMRLGSLQRFVADHDEAIANLRRAVDLAPDSVRNWTALLFALNYADGIASSDIYAAHLEFGRRFAPTAVRSDHANAPDPSAACGWGTCQEISARTPWRSSSSRSSSNTTANRSRSFVTTRSIVATP